MKVYILNNRLRCGIDLARSLLDCPSQAEVIKTSILVFLAGVEVEQ